MCRPPLALSCAPPLPLPRSPPPAHCPRGPGLDLWQTCVGVVAVAGGGIAYYAMPAAYEFRNYRVFFGMFTVLLLAVMLGLNFAAQAFQSRLQGLFVGALVWGEDARLRRLIRKNMARNYPRSKKTHLMFTLAVSNVVYGGVMYTLQARNMVAITEVPCPPTPPLHRIA